MTSVSASFANFACPVELSTGGPLLGDAEVIKGYNLGKMGEIRVISPTNMVINQNKPTPMVIIGHDCDVSPT